MSSDEIEVSNGETIGITLRPSLRCPACGAEERGESVRLTRLERKADKFVASGKVDIERCPNCGAAIECIREMVPIELKGLTCECGGDKFRFTIKSLKPDQASKPDNWVFELDIACLKCNTRKFAQKVADFFNLKRIKVGVTGIDLQR